MKKIIILFLFIPFLSSGCDRYKGEFVFKKVHSDSYKRINLPLEFSSDRKIDWAYFFKKSPGDLKIGVVYLKKEVVWIDIKIYEAHIEPGNRTVYGTIEGLPPGKYQIVLTVPANKNHEIARLPFSIYRGGDESRDYLSDL